MTRSIKDTPRSPGAERVARLRARRKAASEIECIRSDASLYLHPDRLSQKAGAPGPLLRRLVLKEATDNALDVGNTVAIEQVGPDTFSITDDGSGLAPRRVVELFDVSRPMRSTKLLRRPTRGAVGNGLRVVCCGALMSTKGMSTTSARAMVDFYSSLGIPIFVACDLDAAGIRIAGTLGADSGRYRFSARPNMQRLGLKLDQVREMDLQDEPQEQKGDRHKLVSGLRAHGATVPEAEFIANGRRCELNSMTSVQFVAWLEGDLTAAGVKKVLPSPDVLARHAREILARKYLPDLTAIEAEARRQAAEVEIPADIADRVRVILAEHPERPWERALEAVLAEFLPAKAVAAIARADEAEAAS